MGHWGISQNPGTLPQNPRFLQDGAANAPGEKFRVLEGDWVSLPGCRKSPGILSELDFPSGKRGRIRSLVIPHRSASDPHQEFPTFIHAGISVRLEPRKVSHRPHFPPTEILFLGREFGITRQEIGFTSPVLLALIRGKFAFFLGFSSFFPKY